MVANILDDCRLSVQIVHRHIKEALQERVRGREERGEGREGRDRERERGKRGERLYDGKRRRAKREGEG